MATKITAKPNTQVKAPDSLKSLERQFGEVNQYMIDQMAKSFRNQVLLELNKSTIDKFADFKSSFPVLVKEPYTVDVKKYSFFDSDGIEYDEDEVRRMSDHEEPKLYDIKTEEETIKETRYK